MNQGPAPTGNRILTALPARTLKAFSPLLRRVRLKYGDILHFEGKRIARVYFPVDALVSLVTKVDGRRGLEVGMVGFEGMAGVSVALEAPVAAFDALVQGTGSALALRAGDLAAAMRAHPLLQSRVLGYSHELMTQVARTAGCNRFHEIDQRLARWLLMTRDRLGSREFRLTHAFLGQMLGTTRAGITVGAGRFQERGLIEYSRGTMRILDEDGLEAASCSCYTPLKRSRHATPIMRATKRADVQTRRGRGRKHNQGSD